MHSPILPNSADVLLFDIGRVVLDIDFNKVVASWANHAGCEPGDLVSKFSPDEAWHRHERGEISDAMFFENLRASLGIGLTDAQFLEGWNAIFTGEMPGIAPLLAARGTTPAALCVFQHQSGPCRTFLTGLYRRAQPFPRIYICPPASVCANPTRRPMIMW